jgi:hypothetical protein
MIRAGYAGRRADEEILGFLPRHVFRDSSTDSARINFSQHTFD